MQTETPGTAGSSTVDDVPSLADSIGEIMGDYVGDEMPSAGGTDEGATPGSGAPTGSENAADAVAGSERDVANAGLAGAPPADAAAAPLDQAGRDQSDEYTPFTYTVNGEQRTADGIRQVGEFGAIVDAEFLPVLQQRLSERDHLYEQEQARHQQYQAIERLTNWEVNDRNGNRQTLTGQQGLEAQRVLLSRSLASLSVIDKVLSDPAAFAKLVTVVADEQGNGRIVAHPDAMAHLRTSIENAAIRAEVATRGHVAAVSAPQPPAERSVAELAMPTVEATVRQIGATGFTAEDKQFLAGQLVHYVRATTAEERQRGLGPRIVDESFVALVKREAARAQQAARIAQSATSAANQNQRKLAATRPRGVVPTPQQRPGSPQHSRVTDAEQAWDIAERAGAVALRRSMGLT